MVQCHKVIIKIVIDNLEEEGIDMIISVSYTLFTLGDIVVVVGIYKCNWVQTLFAMAKKVIPSDYVLGIILTNTQTIIVLRTLKEKSNDYV